MASDKHHRWEALGRQYVCIDCGWIRQSTYLSNSRYRHFIGTSYQRQDKTKMRAPVCDGWPDDWIVPNRCYSLYLDDLRNPPKIKDRVWIVVRSFDEAVKYVEKHGMPSYVSFDHDLGENVPTGKDFAQWLVNRYLDEIAFFPKDFAYSVHSANPPGAANIVGLMDGFIQFLEIQKITQKLDIPMNDA